jgi:aspartate/methionine/tyrosine aminotransferase
LKEDELGRLSTFCAERRVSVVGDEVFADFPLDDAPAARPSVLSQDQALAFGLGGLSKSAGLPQVKLGWIGVNGPHALVAESLARLELICDTYLSVGTPVQHAAPRLLEGGAVARARIHERVLRNERALRAAAAVRPAVDVLRAEGGWSAVLRVPSTDGEEALVLDLLERDRVLIHPGYFFDFPREAFLVVSLLVAPAEFDPAIERLLARVGS